MKYYVLTNQIKKAKCSDDLLHVALYIGVKEMSFHLMEEDISEYWKQYENHVPIETSLMYVEELGDYFFDELKDLLKNKGIILYQIEIYDNPTKRYCVSEQLLLPGFRKDFVSLGEKSI